MPTDIISAGARNLADWHDACLHSLQVHTSRSQSLWLCEEDAPFIYLSAITLDINAEEQRSEIERLVSGETRPIAVCDCWSRLDLHDLGFEKFETEAWYVRPPQDHFRHDSVELVTDPTVLAEFEHASTAGFESPELHELEPFGVYGETVLQDPRMRVFVRRERERVVAGAIGCISADVVGVYAVATVPEFRRRGFGEEVTWAAVQSAPSLSAVLQPSVQGAALYRRMGFLPTGTYTKWLKLPSGGPQKH